MFRSLIFYIFLALCLAGCKSDSQDACAETKPVWIKPPADSAVSGTPEAGYYFVNSDQTILASAWWTDQEEPYLIAGEDGVKMGWFRPAGRELEIMGKRIDAEAPPLDVHVPCCYPTRFQAIGLIFPTDGCWEINAKAGESILDFVIWVDP